MVKTVKKGKPTRRRVRAEGEEEEVPAQEIKVSNAESDDDSSLKIVQKDSLRQFSGASTSDVDLEDEEMVMNYTDNKGKKKESKRKKKKKLEADLKSSVSSEKDAKFDFFCSDLFGEEEKVEEGKTSEVVDEVAKTDPIEAPDDTVFRKLIRGPRYFDPEGSWGMCYNCGEEGHTAVNCTLAKRKKPCFVCGSQEHLGKQCPTGRDCYICRKGGHRAKDCPEKGKKGAQNSKICLKCGDSGHDMFLCGTDYFSDDLKEIECYVCGKSGHLCCVNYTHSGLRELTCYRCGLSGHTGLACLGSQKIASFTGGSDGSCFRCGEQGHFARECTNAVKRNNESYTTPRKHLKENQDSAGYKSAPQDGVKSRKRKKPKTEREFLSASKPKGKYGWSTEDPEDFTSSRGKTASPWRSPSTPKHKRFRIPDYSATDSPSYAPKESHTQRYNGSNSHTRFFTGSDSHTGHYNGSNSYTQHYNGEASNRTSTSNQPRFSKHNSDRLVSNRTTTFTQPRYSALNYDYSASYGSGMHHDSRFTSSRQLNNSGSNGSADFYQPRYEPRYDRRRNYGW